MCLRRRSTCLLLLLAIVVCPACGDDAREQAAPPPAPAPLPVVEVLPVPVRAAYALDRLLRGPAPLRGLLVKDIHRRNLELAYSDLVSFEADAVRLLIDAQLIERITGNVRAYLEPWHNVLRLLLALKAPPVELVLAWTRPTLDVPLDEDLSTLRAEAARVLAAFLGPRTAPLLLALLEQEPADRTVAGIAFAALMRIEEHREAALELALRRGAPTLWADAWSKLAGAVPAGEVDAQLAGTLAWWVALTAGSGPRMSKKLPNLKSQPWAQARLGTDPQIPARQWHADGSGRLVAGTVPASVAYGSGWNTTELSHAPLFPMHGYVFTGKLPAGEARCALGQWGFAGYRHAVFADLALEDVDEGLYYAAKHCMLDASPASDAEVVRRVGALIDGTDAWEPLAVRKLQRLVSAAGGCGNPAVWDVLVRILRELRPLDAARPILDQAYDAMRPREPELHAVTIELLRGSPEDAGIALYLMRRARHPAYLPVLEEALEVATDPVQVRTLRSEITFIYSRGYGIEPARYAEFVKTYEAWLADSTPQRFRSMATGLLDFGDPGAAAFARGLAGPQRSAFLAAWPRDRRLVPPVVAQAALAPLTRASPAQELMLVLGLAYSSFPRSADAALEALRRRLPQARRGPVEAALERVRHRADRHADFAGK